jgi:predicted transcriptional regulator
MVDRRGRRACGRCGGRSQSSGKNIADDSANDSLQNYLGRPKHGEAIDAQGEITFVNDSDTPTNTAELTAEIVAAYVSNNKIAPSDLAMLISSVGHEMAKVGTAVEPPAEEKPEPAVSVRRSIQPNHLICLVCGKPQKVLKRHLAVQHDLTPGQYRERFELKPDYPMVAPNYAQQRREVALQTGLGRPKKPARRRRKTGPRAQKSELGQSAAAATRA